MGIQADSERAPGFGWKRKFLSSHNNESSAFQARVAEILEVDPARLDLDAYFITDLGVDSLRLADILLRLEDLGVAVSPDLAWEVQTVGDAYRIYQEQVAR